MIILNNFDYNGSNFQDKFRHWSPFWLHSLQLWFDRISKRNNPLRFHGKSFWKIRTYPFPVTVIVAWKISARFPENFKFIVTVAFWRDFSSSLLKKFKQVKNSVKNASSLRAQIEKCSVKSVFCILTRFYKFVSYKFARKFKLRIRQD